ncbi:MAG: hypothetical protein M3O66_00930 [Verrucomicrobiota bacterium]|nr:hypothetical protein [Verrucomicrobiota bacterium]
MIRRFLQFFFAVALTTSAMAEPRILETNHVYNIVLTDVDGDRLSTRDGHVTIITVTTKQNEPKARAVGDRVPDRYLGDPKYRLITLVNFQKKVSVFFRGVTAAVIRHRLDLEAKRIQPIYSVKHLMRDPRKDIFAVADFDGQAVSSLGIQPASDEFGVFVFDGQGRLLRRWSDAPPTEELAASLAVAKF